VHARRGNFAGTIGQVAKAVMEEAHAVACERGQWVCNEKRLIEATGLEQTQKLFSEIPVDSANLVQWVDVAADQLGVARRERMPWA
jgi:hypothetical protein